MYPVKSVYLSNICFFSNSVLLLFWVCVCVLFCVAACGPYFCYHHLPISWSDWFNDNIWFLCFAIILSLSLFPHFLPSRTCESPFWSKKNDTVKYSLTASGANLQQTPYAAPFCTTGSCFCTYRLQGFSMPGRRRCFTVEASECQHCTRWLYWYVRDERQMTRGNADRFRGRAGTALSKFITSRANQLNTLDIRRRTPSSWRMKTDRLRVVSHMQIVRVAEFATSWDSRSVSTLCHVFTHHRSDCKIPGN